MSKLKLKINSESYDYDMIDNVCKKLIGRISDVKSGSADGISDRSSIIQDIFILNSNGHSVEMESRIFLHLFIFSYFLELGANENEILYKGTLSVFVKANIEYYEREFEKSESVYFENENRKKIYEIIKALLEISETVFYKLTSDISKNTRDELLRKAVLKFNMSGRELENIISEKVSVNAKIEKCHDRIEEIFKEDIIGKYEEYEPDGGNEKTHLLKILEDSIKAIYICVILDNERNREDFKIFFNDRTWIIYFCSLIFSNYRKNRVNLLKLNKNMDFLKYGADTKTVSKSVKRFVAENDLKETGKELKSEIFYLLLGIGYNEKAIFSGEITDKNYEYEINPVDENGNGVFNQGIGVYRLNSDSVISDFVNMLLMSDNGNLRKQIISFVKKFERAAEEIAEYGDLDVDMETAINNIFKNLEKNMTERYGNLKMIYSKSTRRQKTDMIKELINIIMQKANINLKGKNNIAKNYKILNNSLKNEINYEIRTVKSKTQENTIFLSHNLMDMTRFENEKTMMKIIETDFGTVEEIKEIYQADINEIKEGKNEPVKSLKNRLIEKYKEKSRIFMEIRTKTDMDERDEMAELIIQSKIFFSLITYNKVKNSKYFLSLNEKFRKIYFNIMTDVIYMLNLKDNFLLQNLSLVGEYDYLGDISDEIESFFLSLYLNDEKDIKKINPEIIKENHDLLNVFRNALINGYLYYEENSINFENDENIGEKEKNNEKYSNTADYLINYIDLENVFI